MTSFTDLRVWQEGMDLVEEIYLLTKTFPREEIFGLTSQLRRASTSIIANVAEGYGRYTYPDKVHKYTIARGESAEVETFLHVAIRIGLQKKEAIEPLIEKTQFVGKMLSGLIESSRQKRV